ncbi:MAG TPA: DUF928 domain-containing protein [Halomicronema sp.]
MFYLKTVFYSSIFALLGTQLFALSVEAGVQPQEIPKFSEVTPEPPNSGTPTNSLPGGTYVRFEPPAGAVPTPDTRRDPGICPVLQEDVSPSLSPGGEMKGPPITALLPQQNFGLTYAEYPTFFIYIPAGGLGGQLILQDEAGNDVQEIDVNLKQKAGVIGVNLSKSRPGLEIGKNYRWFFVLVCTPEKRENDRIVTGWVKRTTIDSDLKTKLDKANPLEKADLYAKNGIWFEALSTLAKIRLDNPKNDEFIKQWKEFLKSGGLQNIAAMPLIAPR